MTLFLKSKLAIFFLLVSLTLLSSTIEHKDKPCCSKKCTGSEYCSACKNCSGCAYCNSGGYCGVCRPEAYKKAPVKTSVKPKPKTKPSTQSKKTSQPVKKKK